MQHEYLVMALQAAAKRHRVLKNGSNSDDSMDVKPSLKHTLNQLALGLLRHWSCGAFTLFSQVRFVLRKFNANSVSCKTERVMCGDCCEFPIIITLRVKSSLTGCDV